MPVQKHSMLSNFFVWADAKNWYSIAQSGTGAPPMYEDIEHSPDWGASFDAWLAVFMKLYAKQCEFDHTLRAMLSC